MNLNDLLNIGATAFKDSPLSGDGGSNLDLNSIVSALSGLTDDGGGFNIAEVVQKLQAGGLSDIAGSWLGDGANSGISPDQLTQVIGADKISDFASKLGLSEAEASGGLADALPQLIDKASSGGSLLDSIGGIEGAIGLAKKIFG